jgi:uncharacterized protein
VIGVHGVRQRCVATTIHPDTGSQDLDVPRHIRRTFGNALGLDCWVIQPGTISVGDPVTIGPTEEVPERIGGWIIGAPYRADLMSRRYRATGVESDD